MNYSINCAAGGSPCGNYAAAKVAGNAYPKARVSGAARPKHVRERPN
jgi:hypothetical protein